MSSLKVKICGLTRPEDVESALAYGADYLGFIVEAKSSRRLSVLEAARLSAPARALAAIVAVTVNPDDTLIEDIVRHMQPDYIQLHGDETPDRAAQIRAKYSVGVIKALAVSTSKDLAAIDAYDVDMILLDAKAPKGETRGGHGKSFDWDMLKEVSLPVHWILAGGLTPQTALPAAQQTKAPILDVSSGVESAAGIKDASKIQALINAVKHEQS